MTSRTIYSIIALLAGLLLGIVAVNVLYTGKLFI